MHRSTATKRHTARHLWKRSVFVLDSESLRLKTPELTVEDSTTPIEVDIEEQRSAAGAEDRLPPQRAGDEDMAKESLQEAATKASEQETIDPASETGPSEDQEENVIPAMQTDNVDKSASVEELTIPIDSIQVSSTCSSARFSIPY